jgi:hypothetical protein
MGLGSGIRKKPIPDPGSRVKKAPDPGSGSATLLLTLSYIRPFSVISHLHTITKNQASQAFYTLAPSLHVNVSTFRCSFDLQMPVPINIQKNCEIQRQCLDIMVRKKCIAKPNS